jgi:hypothetical protein
VSGILLQYVYDVGISNLELEYFMKFLKAISSSLTSYLSSPPTC